MTSTGRRTWDRLAKKLVLHGFRIREFTALMGVHDPANLAALLELDDEQQPYANVYGLHNLRWTLFDPSQHNGAVALSAVSSQALVFSIVYDGNLSDALGALVEQAGDRVAAILEHCVGFRAGLDVARFLQSHAVKERHMFRDLGPLVLPDPEDPWQREAEPEPDATRAEIEDADRIQRDFELFYAKHGREPAAMLRESFRASFAREAPPLGLTRFERPCHAEGAWTRRMIDVATKLQESNRRRDPAHVMRRGAHAKGHALLSARFEVLPSEAVFGLFSKPASYEALLRTSNGAAATQSDHDPDARGLALRVQLPDNASFHGEPARWLQPGLTAHDFLLMNQPVFPAPDIERFAMWFKTAQLESWLDKAISSFGLMAGSGGARQTYLLLKTALTRPKHPFACDYHSTTPYLLGPQHVAKYALEASEPARFRVPRNRANPNALGSALRGSLLAPITLRFYVYLFAEGDRPRGLASLVDAVEDATLDWRGLGAKKVHVANVHIAPQDPTTSARLEQAEALRFNPWHALEEHRPLGSLNRARLMAYAASQQLREAQPAAALSVVPQARAAE